MKLNGTQQLFVYADDVNILGGSVRNIKGGGKKREAVVVARKEIGLEVFVNAEKTKYMAMSRDRNAKQNHNINTDNKFLGRAEQ